MPLYPSVWIHRKWLKLIQSILIWASVSLVQPIRPSQTNNAQVSQAAHSPIKELLPERKHLFSLGDAPSFIAFIKLFLLIVEISTSSTNVVFSLLKIFSNDSFSGNMYVPLFIPCYVSWRNKKVTTYKKIAKL